MQRKDFELLQKRFPAIGRQQQAQLQALTAAVKAQAGQIQKVNGQIMAQTPAPPFAADN